MSESIDYYEPIMSIGMVAQKLEIAVQTIRLYEQEGLILPFKTTTGRRLYSMHDLNRLQCIRRMIKENGLNIQGIKRIFSFIPCWEFKGGLDNDCLNCPAYYSAEGPCWSLSKKGDKCALADCRSCKVYRLEFHCDKLKEIIFGHERQQAKDNEKGQNR